MDTILYPVLCYPLRPNHVLGVLVGTDIRVVEPTKAAVCNTILEHLQRQYKKQNDYPDIDLINPRLKVEPVKIRPVFRQNNGSFPFPQAITVPVAAVFGENYDDYYECYLPLIGEQFFYYDQRQLVSLLKNTATTHLNDYSPDDLTKLARYPAPSLELVPLKVNFDRSFSYRKQVYQVRYETLERLADPYPIPRAQRRQMSQLPEAAWELEDKVDLLITKLLQQRANVLVVGPHGVGKSAVLGQAIRKIHNAGRKHGAQLRFWRIMAQRITASTKYLGEWQGQLEQLILELKACNGILWVEDFIRLLESGGHGPEDSVAAFLISYLSRGDLQLVGELTPNQLESLRRLLPGFAELCQVIELKELPEDRILRIFEQLAKYIRLQHQVQIDDQSLQLIYRLLSRYSPYEQFPGKGVRFIGQCLNEVLLNQDKVIDKALIIQTLTQQTGLPSLFLRDDLRLDKQELSAYFSERIIGQEQAIGQLTDIVKIYKAGLNNPHKPITTLLFAGPTGVGKTASAKAIANYFFGQGQLKNPLVRIDMSEFQLPGEISRLIGDGQQVGQLVKEVRERPFSVLLFDEVEKAHPSVFDALLTVLDEGMLLDAFGRITNFRNSIIILTSNLGASNRKSIGYKQTASSDDAYRSAIQRFFRPEFINRIDNLVFFNSLSEADVAKILAIELKGIQQREGIQNRNLQLHYTPSLQKHLLKVGFDEEFGARPLQRAIEHELVHPLSKWLIQHPATRHATLTIDRKDGQLHVEVKKR